MSRTSHKLFVVSASVALAVAIVLGVGATPLSARTPLNRFISVGGIGGLSLRAGFEDALAHFGKLETTGGRASFDLGGCTLIYPKLGLTLWYIGNPLKRGEAQTCLYFQEGVVTKPGWSTPNGLSIGDSTGRLLRLFPHAYDTKRPGPKWSAKGSIEWDITLTCCGGGQRPALSVMVDRTGHIDALFVEMVGH